MLDNPIKLVVATQKTAEEFHASIPARGVKKLLDMGDIQDIILYPENSRGLSEIYNEALDAHPDCILVFMHDDVHIWDLFMAEKLRFTHQYYQLLGLAGTTKLKNITPETPSAWHMLTAPECGSGLVFHQGDGARWPTVFGRAGLRCRLMDGLFLSVLNDETFRQSGVGWDEDFKFHHYDLAFCARVAAAGMKMATTDIVCLHGSRGESMYSEEWKTNHTKFMAKYYDTLKRL